MTKEVLMHIYLYIWECPEVVQCSAVQCRWFSGQRGIFLKGSVGEFPHLFFCINAWNKNSTKCMSCAYKELAKPKTEKKQKLLKQILYP
jgi:hypothetical protein